MRGPGSEGIRSLPGAQFGRTPRSPQEWISLAAAAVGAVALGWYVASNPGLLRLGIPLNRSTMAGAAAVAVVVAVVLLRPSVALALLVAIVYLNLSDVLVRSFSLPSVLQLMSLPVLIAAWIHHGPGITRRILGEPLTWLLGAYALLLLASATWAQEPGLAQARFAEILKALLLYALIVLLATTPERMRIALWTMVGAGAFLGGLGVLQVTAGVGRGLAEMARVKHAHIYGDVFGPRLAGPLGDPNFFAQILLVLVPLAVFLVWEERTRRSRLAALLCLAIILAASLLTYSRGGALALAFVVPASLVAHGVRWRTIAFTGTVMALGAATLAPAGVRERLATIGQFLPEQTVLPETDSSFQERMVLMGAAWGMMSANPLLGVGAGNYTARFGEYADLLGSVAQDYQDPDDVRYPHNLYLEVGAETGVAGLGLFLAALLAALLGLEKARSCLREAGARGSGAMARALQISLAGYLISSLFLHGDFERYLWLLFGMTGALLAMARTGFGAPDAWGHEG